MNKFYQYNSHNCDEQPIPKEKPEQLKEIKIEGSLQVIKNDGDFKPLQKEVYVILVRDEIKEDVEVYQNTFFTNYTQAVQKCNWLRENKKGMTNELWYYVVILSDYTKD